jgi:hypothetical protein
MTATTATNATTATRSAGPGFRLPRLLLPGRAVELAKWAVIACDQYTSEPEYWRRVADLVGEAPSTLNLVYPEVYLGAPDAPARIARIQQSMRAYLDAGLLEAHDGAVLVERTVDGRTRRGLMLELDLEHYDYGPASTSLIRPTEGTIVSRLAPRIEVRRDAALELPHILVLVDDPQGTVIEPIAAAIGAQRARRPPLYETELMLGGGGVAGFAVDGAHAAAACDALAALAHPAVVARRYGVPEGTPPMLFAVGDGNHSLATAKAIWEQVKDRVGPHHPSRFALVEVENIHDPALHFAPIHRLLIGLRAELRAALAGHFGARLQLLDVPGAEAMRAEVQATEARAERAVQAFGVVGPGARFAVARIADPEAPLAVGTLQGFVDAFVARGGAADVDYVHGDETLERLAQQAGHAGFHLGTVPKGELLKRVMHEGPLPRKTFSMGEAHEKRYYVEARRIR